MKQFRCHDVLPGCSHAFTGTEDDILAEVTIHARDDHGLLYVPDEFIARVRSAMTAV
jgi:predicted small metal-binding protein